MNTTTTQSSTPEVNIIKAAEIAQHAVDAIYPAILAAIIEAMRVEVTK
jgi:hypothetical protein